MIIRRSRRYTVKQRQAAFWAKVEKGEHWLFTGAQADGYGSFWDGERAVGAHVYAWELEHGPVPAGLELRHQCSYKVCVLHLELGTRAQNMQDMMALGTMPGAPVYGDRHGRCKIPDAVITELRQRHDAGVSLRVLGDELGVTKQAVAYAIRHRGGDAQ